jgi:hypothetical protein
VTYMAASLRSRLKYDYSGDEARGYDGFRRRYREAAHDHKAYRCPPGGGGNRLIGKKQYQRKLDKLKNGRAAWTT